ncbi:MAG TPA: MFS transporter [Candidatus Udaeobacter sp.]|nr:MFS transporter [Candidatus Udaeobacter sp.]
MDREKWIGYKSLALLRQGPFRRYIIGSLISDSGTWMQMMAQSWVMSALTNKAILLGLVNFAAGLPALVLAPMAGSLADRFDKRKILVATQIVQIIFAVSLGLLIFMGRVQIWHIIFFALLLGIAFSFEMPAISALVPELVKRDEIAPAIALDRSVFHGSRLIGPSLAGFFVAWWGAASAFFTNALSFVALIVALISLPKRPLGTVEEEEQRRSGIKEGFRYVLSNRIILALIALIACNTVFVFPAISVMLPLYVRNVLHLGATTMGTLMAVSGTGAFLGSIGLLGVARENRLKFMSGNVVAIALGVFFMSRSHGFLLTACAMGTIAIALSMNFGLSNTIVQEHAPAHLRGRVSAVFGMSFFGLMPIAGLFMPGFSDLIGMRTTLTIASIVYGIAAIAILSVAGRHVCDRSISPTPETQPEIEPVC